MFLTFRVIFRIQIYTYAKEPPAPNSIPANLPIKSTVGRSRSAYTASADKPTDEMRCNFWADDSESWRMRRAPGSDAWPSGSSSEPRASAPSQGLLPLAPSLENSQNIPLLYLSLIFFAKKKKNPYFSRTEQWRDWERADKVQDRRAAVDRGTLTLAPERAAREP